MPLYEYRCKACGSNTDHFAPMDSIPATVECERCGMESRRVFSKLGVLMRPEGYSRSPDDPAYHDGLQEAEKREVYSWQHK